MKRTRKKLHLDREAIRKLDTEHLEAVAGGTQLDYQQQYQYTAIQQPAYVIGPGRELPRTTQWIGCHPTNGC